MTETNKVDDLMVGIEHPEIERFVVDAVLDGVTPVKVLVADGGAVIPGSMVPLAILLTSEMYDRVTPPGDFTAETTEDIQARVRAAEEGVA